MCCPARQLVLDQFAVINLQYHQVMQQLILQLKYNAVFPKVNGTI